MAALSTAAFPVFLLHAYGYMTDVPYVAAQSASIFCLLLSYRTGSKAAATCGWALALVALLSRQTAFAIPLAGAAAGILVGPRTSRRVAAAILPIVAFLAVQLAYQRWLSVSGNISAQFGFQLTSGLSRLSEPVELIRNTIFIGKQTTLYLGLCLLPFSLWISGDVLSALGRRRGPGFAVIVLVLGAAWAWFLVKTNQLMPTWDNTWNSTGFSVGAEGIAIPIWVRISLTIAAAMGATLLVTLIALKAARLLAGSMDAFQTRARLFGLLGFAAMLASIIIAYPSWDRYLLPLIPWLIVLLAPENGQATVGEPALARSVLAAVAVAAVLNLGAYSVMELYNHMSERRVIASLIDELTARGVDREIINAGWVFDSPSTKRINDWDNLLNQDVSYFIRQVGHSPDNYTLLKSRRVRRILLPGISNPDEAIFIRNDTPLP